MSDRTARFIANRVVDCVMPGLGLVLDGTEALELAYEIYEGEQERKHGNKSTGNSRNAQNASRDR